MTRYHNRELIVTSLRFSQYPGCLATPVSLVTPGCLSVSTILDQPRFISANVILNKELAFITHDCLPFLLDQVEWFNALNTELELLVKSEIWISHHFPDGHSMRRLWNAVFNVFELLTELTSCKPSPGNHQQIASMFHTLLPAMTTLMHHVKNDDDYLQQVSAALKEKCMQYRDIMLGIFIRSFVLLPIHHQSQHWNALFSLMETLQIINSNEIVNDVAIVYDVHLPIDTFQIAQLHGFLLHKPSCELERLHFHMLCMRLMM
jgi:hypothetical protein